MVTLKGQATRPTEEAEPTIVRSQTRSHFLQLCFNLLLLIAHLLQKGRVIRDCGLQMRVLVTGVAREFHKNLQHPPHQRLGLVQPVGGLQQLGQVVEAMATSDGPGRRLFSSMASARRISGSASPSRFVACSNWARLLRSMATLGWSGP